MTELGSTAAMDTAAALAALDRRLRRELSPMDSHTSVERTRTVTRHLSGLSHGWSGVLWTDLDESIADDVIRAELIRFRESAGPYEWKLYHHDQPVDLGARLTAAGLTAGENESVMVAEATTVPVFSAPAGVELVDAYDADGVERAVAVHAAAFGDDVGWLRDRMRHLLADAPERVVLVLAVVDGEAVGAARTEYHPGTDFAGLWGGGTVAAWRGKGIYKALVSHRARHAERRGVRYLQVDAAPSSEPILTRMGFDRITGTTPYRLA
ncbi:MAG: GNAT family N-acetyltransferase [Actinomycetota bacterium]|nr:GNAT family N-acetyltransferase [Actinomycetota bacterium]